MKNHTEINHPLIDRRRLCRLVSCMFVLSLIAWSVRPLAAQDEQPPVAKQTDAAIEKVDPETLAKQALAANEPTKNESAENAAQNDNSPKIDLLELLFAGGMLMLPIVALSFVVVVFGIERLLGLRRIKVLPPNLIKGIGELAKAKDGFDPEQADELCQRYPSSAATVIRAMLVKIGRPHSEVEHVLAEASDREASRLYSNVRWLSLAAGIAPLMGLLGTVWGMIQAFIVTANAMPGANRSQDLAGGIYVALVTTFAGLSVAIPAAILAHLFEGRIITLFRELDEILLGWMPQIERFEVHHRSSSKGLDAKEQNHTRDKEPVRST